jgi:hypothetical protein
MSSMFDDASKLGCIEREIAMRRRVYPNRVRKGLMSPSMMTREIAIMEEIASDYRARLQPSFDLNGQGQ